MSGCASAAAESPTSRSTGGLRSSMSQTSGASRSADVTGAVRLGHASCMNGVRGSMSVRSNTSASATPAVAVARRNTPATCHASVDRSAPRRAVADRAARHSLGALTTPGHALLLSPGGKRLVGRAAGALLSRGAARGHVRPLVFAQRISGAPVDSVVRSTTSARVVPAAALVSGRRRRLGTCAEPDARRALGALERHKRPDQPASSAASRVRDAARDEGRRMQRLLAAPDLLARGRLSGQQVRAAAAADPTPPGDQGGGEIHHQMARRPG